jgi:hypothetical protein
MATVLTDQGPADVSAGPGSVDQLWLTRPDAETVSGWAMKPQGLCKGDICMPVPADHADDFVRDDRINLAAFWDRMDKPAAHSRDGDVWVFGEGAADRGARLTSLEAPDFSLPDLDGKLHSLSDYRGKKVFLATWASW